MSMVLVLLIIEDKIRMIIKVQKLVLLSLVLQYGSLFDKLKNCIDLKFNSIRIMVGSFEDGVNKRIYSCEERFDEIINKSQSLTTSINELMCPFSRTLFFVFSFSMVFNCKYVPIFVKFNLRDALPMLW